jgi:hypothetical protein
MTALNAKKGIQYYRINHGEMPSILIKTQNKSDTEIVVSAGGLSRKWCATIGIIKDNPNAILSWFEYDDSCALDVKLERSSGTIHLLKSVVKFIKEHYSYIEKLNLVDSAKIKCRDSSGKREISVKISPIQLGIYGQMYYERNFNAVLTDVSLYDIYNMVKAKFVDPSFKESWDIFKIYCRDEKLKSVYESSATLRDFFQIFKSKNYCDYFMSGWAEHYIKRMFADEHAYDACLNWTILVKDSKYPITIKDITPTMSNNFFGGKRRNKSKKNLKKKISRKRT